MITTIVDHRLQVAEDRKESCFHIIADNRNFSQRKCQNYMHIVLAGKSQQTTWQALRRKFCCEQIYFFC